MRRILPAVLASLLACSSYADIRLNPGNPLVFPRFKNGPVYMGDDCVAGSQSTAGAGALIQSVTGGGTIAQDTSPFSDSTDYPYGTCLFTVTANADRGYVGSNQVAFRFGKGACSYHARIYIDTLSDGTNTYYLRVGFLDNITATPVDGAWFSYNSTVNSGEWEGIVSANSVTTGSVNDTNSAAAATTVYIIDIDVNAAGTSAVFKINGTILATEDTNIPTGAARDFGAGIQLLKTAGAGGKTFSLDYQEAICYPTTPRG